MEESNIPVTAMSVAPKARRSNYPAPHDRRMAGREKRALGDHFGLTNFGVNITRLAPGGESALKHRHSCQDELVYVLRGAPTLVTESGETELAPGMCAGFPAGGEAHHLVNRSDRDVVFLEIGDRTPADEVIYPDDDLRAGLDACGQRGFTHRDGTPYPPRE